MKLIAALVVSVMLLLAQSDEPAAHTVTAVRHWCLNDVTRVAIEVSSPFEFRTDRLHNPERIYFDLLNTRPLIDSKRAYVETVNDKLLQKIRVAETKVGVTRIVLDLVGNADATTSTLTSPNRLIIELRVATGSPISTSPPAADLSDRTAAAKPPVSTPAAKPVVAAAPAP